jgi:hypothetical protein
MRGSFVFVGALLVGIGVGQLYNKSDVGTLIGLGVGFILWGLLDRPSWWRRQRD